MCKVISFSFYLLCSYSFFAQENWTSNTSPTYEELILHLKDVSAANGFIELYNMGNSDHGLPIYVCIVNGAQDSSETFKKREVKLQFFLIMQFIRVSRMELMPPCYG